MKNGETRWLCQCQCHNDDYGMHVKHMAACCCSHGYVLDCPFEDCGRYVV